MTEKGKELKAFELALLFMASMPDELKREKIRAIGELNEDNLRSALDDEAKKQLSAWKAGMA